MEDVIKAWLEGRYTPPVAELVGFRLHECRDHVAVVTLQCEKRHHNPMGAVHGGVLTDLADAAMGVSMASTLEKGEGFTTLELQMRYFRPVREGLVTATARPLQKGRRVGVLECDLTDESGAMVARATSSCIVIR